VLLAAPAETKKMGITETGAFMLRRRGIVGLVGRCNHQIGVTFKFGVDGGKL